MDYPTLDKKIKGGHLLLAVTRLELNKADILNILSMETTSDEETVKCISRLKELERELVSARLDLELMGIEVSRQNINQ